jgi:hypothetical protein
MIFGNNKSSPSLKWILFQWLVQVIMIIGKLKLRKPCLKKPDNSEAVEIMITKERKDVRVKNTKVMVNGNIQKEEIGGILESLPKMRSYLIFKQNFLILLLMMKSYQYQITVSKEEKDSIYQLSTKIKRGRISSLKLCTNQ